VLKQAVYEYRRNQQLTRDIMMELRIQMEAWNAALGSVVKGYIQSLAIVPFHVISYTEQQLQLFVSACRRKSGCVLHIDSTGTVVRKFPDQKQPYLYSLLLAGENIPVMEFITTDHRLETFIGSLD
jgi:hypothetical protein